MKVYLSNYRNHWLSPYTILEKVFFWREIDYDEPMIDRLANILDPFCQALLKFLDFVHPKVTYVKIDRWDTWSMDSTLAPIILPMLKQLRASNHGSGFVELEDVPEHLRYSTYEQWDSQECFDFYHDHKVKEGDCDIHARWNWVLDEMIWAFEQICDDDHDAQFHTNGFDVEGYQKHNDRINNGTRLFGKYYRGLWD
jgi:hypothetical protein